MLSAKLNLPSAFHDRVEPALLWLEAALSFIYPAVCQVCKKARAGPAEAFVCAACRDSIQFIKPPICQRCGLPFQGAITTSFECASCREVQPAFSSARSATVAKDSMLEIIHRYKYQHGLWFEPFLAELLISRAAPELAKAEWDWIVPVPLYPAKQREREFNQAERLARRLSRVCQIPVNTKLLFRSVATRTQTALTREERQENVRKAFSMRKKAVVNAKRIVLIDDVFTTGATTGGCASVLRSAGAAKVCVWTVARGL